MALPRFLPVTGCWMQVRIKAKNSLQSEVVIACSSSWSSVVDRNSFCVFISITAWTRSGSVLLRLGYIESLTAENILSTLASVGHMPKSLSTTWPNVMKGCFENNLMVLAAVDFISIGSLATRFANPLRQVPCCIIFSMYSEILWAMEGVSFERSQQGSKYVSTIGAPRNSWCQRLRTDVFNARPNSSLTLAWRTKLLRIINWMKRRASSPCAKFVNERNGWSHCSTSPKPDISSFNLSRLVMMSLMRANWLFHRVSQGSFNLMVARWRIPLARSITSLIFSSS